jgi:hypothetical protein
MSHMGPILGEFGQVRVLFPSPRHRVPRELWPRFELLIGLDCSNADAEDLTRRLEASLGVTGSDRRDYLYSVRRAQGLKARGGPNDVDDLLRNGVPMRDIAQRLGLQLGYIQWRAKQLRSEQRGYDTDITTPRFANDDDHQAAVMALGGYPTSTLDRGVVGPDGLPWRLRSGGIQRRQASA